MSRLKFWEPFPRENGTNPGFRHALEREDPTEPTTVMGLAHEVRERFVHLEGRLGRLETLLIRTIWRAAAAVGALAYALREVVAYLAGGAQ